MTHQILRLTGLMLVFVAAGGNACRAQQSHVGPKKSPYEIICTTGMVADIVRQVAGEKAKVDNIIGEGVDPHLYSATRSDISRLLRADVVFYNGLMLEGKMADALIKVAHRRPVYAVSDLVDKAVLLQPENLEGHQDPHLWMDVSIWKKCTEMVTKALSDFDPANSAYYQANLTKYAQKLDELHEYSGKVIRSIPQQGRVLITAHDAFNYLGRAYDIEVVGIQGISTESEAGIQDINRLVDLLVTRQVKAVFVESSVPDKNVRALIEGAQARGHTVVVGGELFSDAMGRPGTYEGSYLGMIDHNITTITRALGGEAPERGWQEQLTIGH